MTRDELLRTLRAIHEHGGDEEMDHSRADNALLAFINDDEIAEAYAAIEKWYA